ncbi:MAG: hypothetical protein M1823_006228, partial [Watsoniomyces obsoletus]
SSNHPPAQPPKRGKRPGQKAASPKASPATQKKGSRSKQNPAPTVPDGHLEPSKDSRAGRSRTVQEITQSQLDRGPQAEDRHDDPAAATVTPAPVIRQIYTRRRGLDPTVKDHQLPQYTRPRKKKQEVEPRTAPVQERTSTSRVETTRAWTAQVPRASPPHSPPLPPPSAKEVLDPVAWYISRYGYPPSDSSFPWSSTMPEPDGQASCGDQTKQTKKPKNRVSTMALKDRNVSIRAGPNDPMKTKIEAILKGGVLDITKEDQRRWEIDLHKSEKSNEYTFQHTIMTDLIGRHDLEASLDYACEVQWGSPPAPRNNDDGPNRLPAIQPDLVVGFKTDLFFDDVELSHTGALQGHICPEKGDEQGETSRSFHFFGIEAKRPRWNGREAKSHLQNLLVASQALYNIYNVMKEVDELDLFYSRVRFFSLAASTDQFKMRVHRATEVQGGLRITTDYPLSFRFQEVDGMSASECGTDKAKVVGKIRSILHHYGVKMLLPVLQRTAKKMRRKFGDSSIAPSSPSPPSSLPWPSPPPLPPTLSPLPPSSSLPSSPRRKRAADGPLDAPSSSVQRRRFSDIAFS